MPYAQRVEEMHAHGVGLWDVFAACAREGSLDSAIRDAAPNDLASLARRAPGLRAVIHNGQASARERRATDALGVDVHVLPSTSPANAAWSLERHRVVWAEVLGRYDPA
jgi:hypoxanthine-DNA glycosylase